MLTWLENNMPSVIAGVLVIAVLTAVIYSMVRNKKQGKSSCGCSGCSGCNGCGGGCGAK